MGLVNHKNRTHQLTHDVGGGVHIRLAFFEARVFCYELVETRG